jgi:hypothetical protein
VSTPHPQAARNTLRANVEGSDAVFVFMEWSIAPERYSSQ